MTSELTVLQLSRHMQLSPGDKLGPYEILVFIGAGGMSEVYRAQDVKWHRIALYGMGHASIRWCVRRRRAQLMPFMGKASKRARWGPGSLVCGPFAVDR